MPPPSSVLGLGDRSTVHLVHILHDFLDLYLKLRASRISDGAQISVKACGTLKHLLLYSQDCAPNMVPIRMTWGAMVAAGLADTLTCGYNNTSLDGSDLST